MFVEILKLIKLCRNSENTFVHMFLFAFSVVTEFMITTISLKCMSGILFRVLLY
jgi:hypothetical protein